VPPLARDGDLDLRAGQRLKFQRVQRLEILDEDAGVQRRLIGVEDEVLRAVLAP
jgi:hypothetical protein